MADVGVDIVRAWRDPAYREGLPSHVVSRLPSPPPGLSEMSDEQLRQAAGAMTGAAAYWALAGSLGAAAAGVGTAVPEIMDAVRD